MKYWFRIVTCHFRNNNNNGKKSYLLSNENSLVIICDRIVSRFFLCYFLFQRVFKSKIKQKNCYCWCAVATNAMETEKPPRICMSDFSIKSHRVVRSIYHILKICIDSLNCMRKKKKKKKSIEQIAKTRGETKPLTNKQKEQKATINVYCYYEHNLMIIWAFIFSSFFFFFDLLLHTRLLPFVGCRRWSIWMFATERHFNHLNKLSYSEIYFF